MATKTKPLSTKQAFAELTTLYDTADNMENDGDSSGAEYMRETLDKIGKYILNSKPKK